MNLDRLMRVAASAALLGGLAGTAAAQTNKVLFSEDFDGIALGPNVEEGILTGSGGPQTNVWSASFPAGWDRTFSLPGVGVLEWQGWSIADPAWWALATGDQRRGEFSNPDFGRGGAAFGRGGVAIVDGDEWDDFDANDLDPSAQGTYDAFMTTPPIDTNGAVANSMRVQFASSFRTEDPQKATVEVSFDGGPFEPIFLWTADDTDPLTFKADAPSELIGFDVENPAGASSVRFRFGYFDAGNNWWWAVDNIQVTADTANSNTQAPGLFFIDADTFQLTNRPVVQIDEAAGADGYTVEFAKDADFTDVEFSGPATAGAFELGRGSVPSGVYFVRVIATNAVDSRDSYNTLRVAIDTGCDVDLNGDGFNTGQDFFRFLEEFTN